MAVGSLYSAELFKRNDKTKSAMQACESELLMTCKAIKKINGAFACC